MQKPTNAIPGDFVEVHMLHKIYLGTLLESPESETILLKLENGYNIGFIKKEVQEIKLVKRAEKIKETISIKQSPEKPNIAMIITGGTIASKYDAKTGAVTWLDTPESLAKIYPGLFKKVNVSKLEIPFMKGSENMDSKDWKKIAKLCESFLEDPNIKGIIITHGTDTLHYTSSALSFFLGKLNKPVVLTYSQRSVDRASSDAELNLICSANLAVSDIAEVMLVGHASTNDDFCYALRGSSVRKMHSSRRDAFKPINSKPIAKVYTDKIEVLDNYNPRNKGKLSTDICFDEKVALLKFYPGQEPEILDYYLKNKFRGIVIEMLGLGHVATSESRNSWIKKLKELQDKGIIICATPQTIYGRLDPLVYSTGRELLKTGVIFLGNMLSETAFVKLGWVLGHSDWAKDRIKEKMLENVSGEISDRLED